MKRRLRIPRIFISYRREDSAYPAQRIHEELSKHFGDDAIVFDVDVIPLGIDFRIYLGQQVRACDILLCVIGDRWLDTLVERLE